MHEDAKKKTSKVTGFIGESPNTKLKLLRNCGVDLNGELDFQESITLDSKEDF